MSSDGFKRDSDRVFTEAAQALYHGNHEKAAQLFQQFLSYDGVSKSDTVFALGSLCSALWRLNRDHAAVEAGEAALRMDEAEGLGEFEKKPFRDMVFQVLETEWVFGDSKELRAAHGPKVAAEMLLKKLSLLDYLPGTYMPIAQIRVADLLFDSDQLDVAKTYYKRGIDADPPFDPDGGGPEIYARQVGHARARWSAMGGDGSCWVATVLYGPDSTEVSLLRELRDQVLVRTSVGRFASSRYYRTGPALAAWAKKSGAVAAMLKWLLVRPALLIAGAVLESGGSQSIKNPEAGGHDGNMPAL